MARTRSYSGLLIAALVWGAACDSAEKPSGNVAKPSVKSEDPGTKAADDGATEPSAAAKKSPHMDTVRNGEPEAAAQALDMMIGGRFDIPLPPELEGILLAKTKAGQTWAAENLIHVGGVEAAAKGLAATKDTAVIEAIASSIGIHFRLSSEEIEVAKAEKAAKAIVGFLGTDVPPSALFATLRDIGPQGAGISRAPVAARLGNAEERDQAAYTLAAIGAGDAVDGLFEYLADDDAQVRIAVAQAIGCSGRDVVPRLVEALGDSRVHARETAARALSHIEGDAAASAVGPLTRLVAAPQPEVATQAAHALGALGPVAAEALPALQAAAAEASKASPAGAVDFEIAIMGIKDKGSAQRPDSCPHRGAP